MLKEIFNGIVLRNSHGIFIKRTIIVALHEKDTNASLQTEVAIKYHPVNSAATTRYYTISQINNPTLGMVIVLSIDDPEMNESRDLVKEALRVALSNGLDSYGHAFSLDVNTENERFWLNKRLTEIYEDACDRIDFELSK